MATITTTISGKLIHFINNLKASDHVILFYDTPENKRSILFNFLSSGLANRKGAFYVCSEESPEQIRTGMESFGMDVENFENEGRLMICNYDQWYIVNGQVECLRILACWKEIYEIFRKKGLGLRGTGETNCFFKHNKVKELLRYEYALHRVLDIPMEAVCAYNVNTIVDTGYSEIIMPLVRTHGRAIFTGPGGSIIYEPEKIEEQDIEKLLQIRI